MIHNTDKFLTGYKNKIMLISIAFIIACCIGYFAVSADKISTKAFIIFLISLVFLSAFYGIKFLLNVRNKFMPLNLIAGYILDMLCAAFAVFVIFMFIYDFILTFDGFNLIIFSVFSALLNAIIFARVKDQRLKKS